MAGSTHLYILCGLSFAGKTTLGKRMAQLLDCAIVHLDAINDELSIGVAGAPISPQQWEETYNQFHGRIAKLLQDGHSVLCDAASFTRVQRDILKNIAVRAGAKASVIYIEVSPAVATARWQQNRLQSFRSDVRDENFAYVLNNFEPPTADEDVLVYEGSTPLDQWVRVNFL